MIKIDSKWYKETKAFLLTFNMSLKTSRDSSDYTSVKSFIELIDSAYSEVARYNFYYASHLMGCS